MNIAHFLLNRARAQPEAPALSFSNQTLSYAELAQAGLELGRGLREGLGLKSAARIVICMENCSAFVELLFGCWIAGLCAVPVNAKLHPREVAHIAADCGARAVFTSPALAPGLLAELQTLEATPQAVVTDSAAWAALRAHGAMACTTGSPEDLAWIFYTSGTTGKPKGAMLSHRNLTFMSLAYHADIDRIEPGHVLLHAAPLSHGSGLYGLPHLFAGGHQIVLPGFDASEVLQALHDHQNVSMFAAPTMVTRLLQAAGAQPDVPGLRTLVYGGGPMYVSDLQTALAAFGPRLAQLYGQGESPMTITLLSRQAHLGSGDAAHQARLGSCGLARTGVQVRVVDEQGQDLPVGESGEVITRSDCVMQGYWNNPQATQAALRDGWLWTGDIGSLDEQGYLTLRDRSKDMIISGGTNIYPREVEEVLLRHPAVLECSVVGRAHADWGEEVVAFIVAREGQALNPRELDDLCLARIARFKRPKAYFRLQALPKNAYGKVLKTALRERLKDEE
ncbi:MAG: class I adenylate-forming enzyme family protein [Burkholderiales bacterium]